MHCNTQGLADAFAGAFRGISRSRYIPAPEYAILS
jgi:hypothetical protein